MDAVPTQHFAIPPYSVESFKSGWHCILNANGFNCTSFLSKPGAKFFTSRKEADETCALWNKQADQDHLTPRGR